MRPLRTRGSYFVTFWSKTSATNIYEFTVDTA
jgi:hypothetical protein